MRLCTTGMYPGYRKTVGTRAQGATAATHARQTGTENAHGEMKSSCGGPEARNVPRQLLGGLAMSSGWSLSANLPYKLQGLEHSMQEQQET